MAIREDALNAFFRTRHEQEPLAAALDEVFDNNPRARSYVLDDQNALRKHMNIFVDGRAIADRRTLSDETSPTSHIYVVQALSGG